MNANEKMQDEQAFFHKMNFSLTCIKIFSIIPSVTLGIEGRTKNYGIAKVPKM